MGSRHAVVVSYLALFIALGGTAAALQGRRTVGTKDIASGAITTRTLAHQSVGTQNLKGRAVDTDQIARDSVGRNKIKAQAVDSNLIANGTIASGDLAPQTRIPFAEGGGLPAILNQGVGVLRIATPRLEWSGSEGGPSPATLESSPGGGGLILNGSTGSQSGYLRFYEGSGSPPDFVNTATLVARDNGTGKTQLVVFWPGGTSQVLAAQP